MQLIQHEVGRIVPVIAEDGETVSDYDYQYHLKDHLGNVRLTFSTTPENYTITEDFEDAQSDFQKLNPVSRPQNTTAGGSYMTQTLKDSVNAVIVLSLNKGDTINLSVNANYPFAPSESNFAQTGWDVLFGAFGDVVTSGGTESIQVPGSSTVFGDALSGAAMAGKDDSSTEPRAYLNYIIFDEAMNFDGQTGQAGFKQVSSAALGTNVENLAINEIIAEHDGYLVAYLSNENSTPVEVYFDDFTIYHGKTNVVSTQDYYPFGLTFNESAKLASTEQRYKYGGKEEQKAWSHGVLDFEARFYDAAIGRFMNIDPLADLGGQEVWTPYHYTYNNPIIFIDPTGMFGDYYNRNGKHVGNDGKDDNKVYVIDTEDFNVNTNITELDITHSEFATIAYVIKHESGGGTEEAKWLAHTGNNNANMTNTSFFNKMNSSYSSVKDKQPLSTADNSSRANNARAGVLDVLTGGSDPTSGATFWDGTDFLAWGLSSPYSDKQGNTLSHAKFRQYTRISISEGIYQEYLNNQLESYPSGTVTYSGNQYSIPAPIFSSIYSRLLGELGLEERGIHIDTGASSRYKIKATGAIGGSIFWKRSRK